MYYRNASAAVVVFDVTNKDSFEGAKSWVRELQKRGEPDVVIALAGNKCDISNRAVTTEEAREYAAEIGDIIYVETSAKTGTGVQHLFESIAKKLPKTTERDNGPWVPFDNPSNAKSTKSDSSCCGGK